MSWLHAIVVSAAIGFVVLVADNNRTPLQPLPGPNDYSERMKRAYEECVGYGGQAFVICVTRKMYPGMYNTKDI